MNEPVENSVLHEFLKPLPALRIVYDKELSLSDVPYSVTVDNQGLASFFRDAGIADDVIEKTTVKIERRPRSVIPAHDRTLASYKKRDNVIIVYTDEIWNTYQRLIRKERKNLKKKDFNPDTINETAKVSISGALDFNKAEQKAQQIKSMHDIALKKSLKELQQHFAHETKHLADFQNLLFFSATRALYGVAAGGLFYLYALVAYPFISEPKLYISGLLVSLIGHELAYLIDPAEIRANRFKNKMQDDPRWNSLVTFQRRDPI